MIIWALVRSSSDSRDSARKASAQGKSFRPRVTVRTLGNVHIEPSQSRFGLQVARIGLEVAGATQRTKPGTRARCGERTLRDSA